MSYHSTTKSTLPFCGDWSLQQITKIYKNDVLRHLVSAGDADNDLDESLIFCDTVILDIWLTQLYQPSRKLHVALCMYMGGVGWANNVHSTVPTSQIALDAMLLACS